MLQRALTSIDGASVPWFFDHLHETFARMLQISHLTAPCTIYGAVNLPRGTYRTGGKKDMTEQSQPDTAPSASSTANKREHFASRLGFILISAGCAIGLGNVWRFPYITGEYGGAAFVLLYLVFLVILGLPVMVMEFAAGRASQKSSAQAFDVLQPSRKWHWFSWRGYIGCMILMMFYTTVCGWMLSYIPKMASGIFTNADASVTGAVFNNMLANPVELIGWMLVAVLIGFAVCSLGLQKGVERITKFMMATLFLVMIALCIRAVTLPPARVSRFTSSPTSHACSQAARPPSRWRHSATPFTLPWGRRSSLFRSVSRPWRSSAATSERSAR